MPFFSGMTTGANVIPQMVQGTASTIISQSQTGSIFNSTFTTTTNCIVSNCTTSSTPTSTIWLNVPDCTTATTITNVYAEFVIDEEDLVNHAEYFELARQRGIAFRIRTAEERRLAEEAAARAREEAERRRAARREAESRARELLLSHLTAEQRETFETNKWFIVVGGKSRTEYRIRTGVGLNGNIDVMRKGVLCCHCRQSEVPHFDQYLAQKLALMWDEDNFLRLANRHAA